MKRRLGLLYALASTYLVARLLLNRLLLGAWGVDMEFVADVVVVSLAQLGLVGLFRLGRARRLGETANTEKSVQVRST
ncbi:MAG: hypothetical protein ACHQQS_04255 [Thermoanaerobaculales bacterium]|jgi:hypothetical protein